MSIIKDRIGRHEVPLPMYHNHYNLRRKQIHVHLLEKIAMSHMMVCGFVTIMRTHVMCAGR